jgi:hypothetical protein
MTYLDTTHVQASVQTVRHALVTWLFPANPRLNGRPALQRALRAHVQQVQQMLLAATLSAASIVGVAAALLIHT